MSAPWYDYRIRFPLSDITEAMLFWDQVRASGFLGDGSVENMLGDPRDEAGNIVTTPDELGGLVGYMFTGRPGRAATSYTDPATDKTVPVPAVGDPAMMYIHARVSVPPDELALRLVPAAYGILPSDPTISAAVLGVWASDPRSEAAA